MDTGMGAHFTDVGITAGEVNRLAQDFLQGKG